MYKYLNFLVKRKIAVHSTLIDYMAILTLRPSRAGISTQWLPSSAPNWECVNEVVASDVDFVDIRDTNKIDYYTLPYHTIESGVINSVTVYVRAVTSSNGNVYIAVYTHGTGYFYIQTTTTSYGLKSTVLTTNPSTNNAWTWAEIDFLQVGEKTASGSYESRVSQVYVEVNYTPATTYEDATGNGTVACNSTGSISRLRSGSGHSTIMYAASAISQRNRNATGHSSCHIVTHAYIDVETIIRLYLESIINGIKELQSYIKNENLKSEITTGVDLNSAPTNIDNITSKITRIIY